MKIKFIAFGAGVGSSTLLFVLNPSEYQKIIYCDISDSDGVSQVPEITQAYVNLIEKSYPGKFVRLKTTVDYFNPPICTKEAKIAPTRRYLRSIGVTKAIKYLGFTYEEKHRAKKKNYVKWVDQEYPLVKAKLSRQNCQQILLNRLGFIPPRTGCICCKNNKRSHLVNGINKKTNKILQAYFVT